MAAHPGRHDRRDDSAGTCPHSPPDGPAVEQTDRADAAREGPSKFIGGDDEAEAILRLLERDSSAGEKGPQVATP